MALGMTAVLIGEAICVSVDNTGASVAAVVFVWLFEACFTWGWMATVWIYPPEILALKVRAKGASLAAAADFLGNFLVVEVTPVGLQNIGWKFYIVWAVLNLVNAVIVWCLYPETGGLPLEAVDDVFVENSGLMAAKGVAGRFQWQYVGKSKQAVREWRINSKAEGGIRESVVAKQISRDEEAGAESGSEGSNIVAEKSEVQHIERAA